MAKISARSTAQRNDERAGKWPAHVSVCLFPLGTALATFPPHLSTGNVLLCLCRYMALIQTHHIDMSAYVCESRLLVSAQGPAILIKITQKTKMNGAKLLDLHIYH